MGLYVGNTEVSGSFGEKDKTKYGLSIDSILGDVDANGALQAPVEGNIVFNGVKSVGKNMLKYRFYYNTTIKSVDFPDLTSIGDYGLTSCFHGCSSLTTAPTFDKITSSGKEGLSKCFYSCSSLTTAPTFANLTSIGGSGLNYCFYNTKITTLSFPALKSTSFGYSTNQFYNMLNYVTGCTVHFPSNLASVIGSWSDVERGFGGTNTTVLFDLPATE